MNLTEYLKGASLFSKKEIDKVIYLAYFNLQGSGEQDFTMGDIGKWFSSLNLPKPNVSRLRKNIRRSRNFTSGSNRDSFRIHGNALERLSRELSPLLEPILTKAKHNSGHYVNPARINELRSIKSPQHDFRKLIQICEEMNVSCKYECYVALITLGRALIDHIPPVFGCKTFSEVSNNYKGSKSFGESMRHLSDSLRKIADQHLHCQIRKREILPTLTQVDFSNDIDVLLGEIVRISS